MSSIPGLERASNTPARRRKSSRIFAAAHFFRFPSRRAVLLKARGLDASSRRMPRYGGLHHDHDHHRHPAPSRSSQHLIRRRHVDRHPAGPARSAGEGTARGMTHSPRRLPSTMSEHHERRSAAPSLVHDRVLTDRPGNAETGARSTPWLEQAAPAARGHWIAVVLRGVSRCPRCWFGRRG